MLRWELNWSSLYYASELLLVLSICAGVLYVISTTLLTSVGDACSRYDNRLTRWLNSRHVTPRLRRHVNRALPLVTMLMVGYILGAAGIFSPIRERHNVEVVHVVTPNVIRVVEGAVEQKWKICEDGDTLPLKDGMVMTVMQYEQGPDCIRFTPRTLVKYLNNATDDVVDKNGNLLFER